MTRRLTMLHSLPVWLPATCSWLYNQVRHLPDSVESHISCESTDNLDQFSLPNLHPLTDAPKLRYASDKGLRKLGLREHLSHTTTVARSTGASLVHSHWGDQGYRDLGAVAKAGARHVVTFYGKDVNYLPRLDDWSARYNELFAKVDLVLCEGEHMARAIEKLGCPGEKVRVQRLGIDLTGIEFRPRRWNRDRPLRLLFASSFREKKGIPYGLEAIGKLKEDGVDLEITIIGDASDDPRSHPEKTAILDTIERCGLTPHARLLGYQPHRVVMEEAYEHDVFLAPSVTAADGDTEGGAPVVITEMIATGMPVVSTFHCDIPAIVLHERTGLLAPERSSDALAGLIRRLVDAPQDWEPMVSAGRRHVEANFDARAQGRLLAERYAEVLGAT